MLISGGSILAQDLSTTEVNIFEGFNPKIPEASRLNENAIFSDTIKKDRTQIYDILDKDLESDYQPRTLAVARVKDGSLPKLYSKKIGLGIGSSWISQAQIVYNTKRSRELSYGVILNHYSNDYSVSKNSANRLALYGKRVDSSYIFLMDLDYNRTKSFYDDQDNINNYDLINRFAYTRVSFSVISRESAIQKLNHKTNFFVSDLNEFSENQIHLSSSISKLANGLPFKLDIEFDNYYNYNNKGAVFKGKNVKLFSFSPSTCFVKYGLDLEVGFDLDMEFRDSPIRFSPEIEVKKELVKNILLIYGGLRHEKKRHSIKSLSDENPYIHSYGTNQSISSTNSFSQRLETTHSNEFYIGMRNILSSSEVLYFSGSYGFVNNFAHFLTLDNSIYHRFQVSYLDVEQLYISFSYDRRINDIMNFQIEADYYKWDEEIYHKPNFSFSVMTPVNLRNKIKLSPSLNYLGKRRAAYYFTDSDMSLSSLRATNELAARFQANLLFDYLYSKQLSAYLHFKNITNSRKDLWEGYREIGFHVVFGVNYSF